MHFHLLKTDSNFRTNEQRERERGERQIDRQPERKGKGLVQVCRKFCLPVYPLRIRPRMMNCFHSSVSGSVGFLGSKFPDIPNTNLSV